MLFKFIPFAIIVFQIYFITIVIFRISKLLKISLIIKIADYYPDQSLNVTNFNNNNKDSN